MFDTLTQAWNATWPASMAAMAFTIVATRRVLGWLHRRQILDLPNERSSHVLPTPRGGGLATTPVVALLLLAVGWNSGHTQGIALGIGALVLMALSWWDDRHTLPALPRLVVHAIACAVFLWLLPEDRAVFLGILPPWADRSLALVGWLWFVNLYNFMDGIDGITGSQTAALGIGIAVVGALAGAWELLPYAGIAAAAGLGFLAFNWHPAKLFLGDSGSIPFGYVLGGLLVLLAAEGQLVPVLILSAYYVADATITLGRRVLNREKVLQPHRKHFYQRAVRGGKRHDQVVLAITAANAVLIGCAVLAAMGHVGEGIAGAVVITTALLVLLQRWAKGASS